jgi:hypothetical protein
LLEKERTPRGPKQRDFPVISEYKNLKIILDGGEEKL